MAMLEHFEHSNLACLLSCLLQLERFEHNNLACLLSCLLQVCSMCNLKGSCDKAYVIAKEDEPARIVDVIRIILTYAINPASLLGVENPPVNLQIQESARKLLSELIKLSDTTIDPALPKPVVQSPSQKEPSQKFVNMNNSSQNVEMKRGDLMCPKLFFYIGFFEVQSRSGSESRNLASSADSVFKNLICASPSFTPQECNNESATRYCMLLMIVGLM